MLDFKNGKKNINFANILTITTSFKIASSSNLVTDNQIWQFKEIILKFLSYHVRL